MRSRPFNVKRRQTISWTGRWPQFDASQGLLKPHQAAGKALLEVEPKGPDFRQLSLGKPSACRR